MKVPAEKGTLENTEREGNHDNSYWGNPAICVRTCGGYQQEENTVLLVMMVCFHGRHSSSESDTGEKKRKKRGKEQLDRSERQK